MTKQTARRVAKDEGDDADSKAARGNGSSHVSPTPAEGDNQDAKGAEDPNDSYRSILSKVRRLSAE